MLTVDQIFREFLAGRRPFAAMTEALRAIISSNPDGATEVSEFIERLVERRSLPRDLAQILYASLNIGQVANKAVPVDPIDPPTEPLITRGPSTTINQAHMPLPTRNHGHSGGSSSGLAGRDVEKEVLRQKMDDFALSSLASDFKAYRRSPAEGRLAREEQANQQLDAALAEFRGARLRRDATKSAQGTARSFNYSSLLAASTDKPVGVGTILKNRFALDREIGRGGMGVVYRAVDKRRLEAMHNQPYVAVKLLSDEMRRSPDALRTLEAEARRAQDLAHPNIVNTFDFDRDGANVFIVMELLEGKTLENILSENLNGLGYDASRGIIEGICSGLAYAHQHGVIHCDLKPSNVFLEATGGLKVLDFGISTAGWAGGFDLTSLNAYTLSYASPEVMQGAQRDPRDDIYSLGCLAYLLITGRHPFNRHSGLDARNHGLKPSRPSGLPNNAWNALLGALEFDRMKRTKSVLSFQKEFASGGLLRKWWR